jgi:hypothetical protein
MKFYNSNYFKALFLLLFCGTFSYGQVVERLENETALQFAERNKPGDATLTHKVLETKWNEVPVIILFYDQIYTLPKEKDPDQQSYHKIVGAVFLLKFKNTYVKTTLGPIDTEGGDPFIESVFFANADTDKVKELLVIASWPQVHYEVSGTLYGTFVFNYEFSSATTEWNFLQGISEKLSGGCECQWSDGSSKKAKFKTAFQVKKELKRLGF